jgi:hypothetical protein
MSKKSTRAEDVIALLDAVTVGAFAQRIQSEATLANIRKVWGAALDGLSDKQYARLMIRIPTDVRGGYGVPTLGDVLALSRSEFDGCE